MSDQKIDEKKTIPVPDTHSKDTPNDDADEKNKS